MSIVETKQSLYDFFGEKEEKAIVCEYRLGTIFQFKTVTFEGNSISSSSFSFSSNCYLPCHTGTFKVLNVEKDTIVLRVKLSTMSEAEGDIRIVRDPNNKIVFYLISDLPSFTFLDNPELSTRNVQSQVDFVKEKYKEFKDPLKQLSCLSYDLYWVFKENPDKIPKKFKVLEAVIKDLYSKE
jgi:hypothetical protein